MTYYEKLGLTADATPEQFRSAFKRLAKKYHPDLNHEPGSRDKFMEAFEAYDVLKDEQKRKLYDAIIAPKTSTRQTPHKDAGIHESAHTYEEADFEAYEKQARSRAAEYANQDWNTFSSSFLKVAVRLSKTPARTPVLALLYVLYFFCAKIPMITIFLLLVSPIVLIPFCVVMNEHEQQLDTARQRALDHAAILQYRERFLAEFPEVQREYSLRDKKIVIMDMRRNSLAEMFFSLDAKNKPQHVNEVDYVIQLHRSNEKRGEYSDGMPGYTIIYLVNIIDFENQEKAAQLRFEGGDPPAVKRGSGAAYGRSPLGDIEATIRQLLAER